METLFKEGDVIHYRHHNCRHHGYVYDSLHPIQFVDHKGGLLFYKKWRSESIHLRECFGLGIFCVDVDEDEIKDFELFPFDMEYFVIENEKKVEDTLLSKLDSIVGTLDEIHSDLRNMN